MLPLEPVCNGAQRVIGEEGFPEPGGELGDARGGMLADALQDVDQVGVGIDAMESAGDDQALDDADLFGAELGPAEEPGPSAHGDDAQCALEMVGIDRDIGIGDEHLEAEPAGFGVGKRLDERMTGREPLPLELALDPVEEHLDLGFAVGEPIELFGIPDQVLIADFLLDGIERLDLGERLFNAVGL